MTSKDETLPDRLREAADRVSRHCFHKAGDDTLMSIPARPGYDVDLLLGEAADEIERLDGLWRTEKARADFNFEENERLRAALTACQTYDYRTLADEIERLRGEAEVADEQLAQLRGFAQDHQKCELIREENQRFRQALESISEIGVSERVGINKHKLHAAMDIAKRALIPVPAARPCGCVGGTCVTQTQDWKLPPGVYCSFET